MEYFEYNTVLSTSFHHSTDTPFPVITICNLNSFNTVNGRNFLNEIQSSFNKSFKLNSNEYFNYSSLKQIKEHLDYAKAIIFENKTIYNDKVSLESYHLKLDYLFISCYFGEPMCNTSDFEYFYDTKYTNCYRFNSGLNRLNQSMPIKKMLKYPYSNCIDTNELRFKTYLIDKTVKLIGSYNKQFCQKLCVTIY